MAPTIKQIGSMDLERSWPYGDNTWKPGMDRNLQKMSAIMQGAVMSRTTPIPDTGSPGDRYINPATGDILMWDVDSDDEVAKWLAITPLEPTLMWVNDEDVFVTWTDIPAAWNVMFNPTSAIPSPAVRAVATFVPGEIPPVTKLWILAVRVSFNLAVDFAGSQGHAEVPPSGGDVIFSVQKNGTEVGTMTFTNGVNAATFASAAGAEFVEGDLLTIVSPSAVNGVSALAVTLKGSTPGL